MIACLLLPKNSLLHIELVIMQATCAYSYCEAIPLGKSGKSRVDEQDERLKHDITTAEVLLSSKYATLS